MLPSHNALGLLLAVIVLPVARADDKPHPTLPKTGLVLPATSRGGRAPVIVDALEAQRLSGVPAEVKEGDEITLADGSMRKWAKIEADKDGVFRSPALRGGYLRLEVESPAHQVRSL